ncbi:MAG: ATP-binding protein [Syntrophobacteraceae bacterium]|nr:ATP-binding protein [Syntrophobacteraceae bacterium]
MIVAIASGKGGTGKTTVAASLTRVWERPLVAVDLDVEAPNLHLFLRPEIEESGPAWIETPVVDESKCTHCLACSALCQFKAISVMGSVVLAFSEMCHGCGGCIAICPEKAISAGKRELGEISRGYAGNTEFLMGCLRIGEAMSPPLMRQVKSRMKNIIEASGRDAIIDAPPGVSCPAVNAVMDSDVIVLVTEPTPFGLHDFKLAWEAFSPFGKPMGVVINRAGVGDREVYSFCAEKGIPVLAEAPYERAAAEGYARGRVIADLSPEFRNIFVSLHSKIFELAAGTLHKEAAHA